MGFWESSKDGQYDYVFYHEFLLFYLFLCVPVPVCVLTCIHVYACVSLETRSQCLVSYLITLHLIFQDRASH